MILGFGLALLGALRFVASNPSLVGSALGLVIGAPRLVAGAHRYSLGCHQIFYVIAVFHQHSQVHLKASVSGPVASEGHSISPVNSGIGLPCNSGQTTP